MQSFCLIQFTFNNFKTFYFSKENNNFVKRACLDAVIAKISDWLHPNLLGVLLVRNSINGATLKESELPYHKDCLECFTPQPLEG